MQNTLLKMIKTKILMVFMVCVYDNECMEKSLEDEQQIANNNIVLAMRFRVGVPSVRFKRWGLLHVLVSIHLGYSILFE